MKKGLITMLVALCLVAALGVGATLAFLTDSSDEKTNTFTVGKVDIELTETGDNNGTNTTVTETEKGIDYTNVQPGDVLNKKPVVTVADDSQRCYVFVKITDVENITLDVDKTLWLAKGDGVYQYKDICKAGDSLTVFNTATIADSITESGKLGDVKVMACAVQADNNTEAAALAQAKDLLK